MRRRCGGNAVLETALWVPVLVLLMVGMLQFGKITYLYYSLKKAVYTTARYIAVQQNVNFCDPADPTIQNAINLAVNDPTTGQPLISNFTADMISVTTQCSDPNNAGILAACDTSGCDGALGARRPDYVVVSIPNGFPVTVRIPFLTPENITLRPAVTVPFGGTSL